MVNNTHDLNVRAIVERKEQCRCRHFPKNTQEKNVRAILEMNRNDRYFKETLTIIVPVDVERKE